MKIENFEKLAVEMEEGTYEQNYKSIEKTLYFSSFLGNAASIVFAFFFVNNIVGTIHHYVSGQQYVLPVIIVAFLTAYEFLKRFIFRRLMVNALVDKRKFTVKSISGMLFTIALIAGSFYMSLNGAKQVVDTSAEVQQTTDSTLTKQTVQLDSIYETDVKGLKEKIQFNFDNAKKRGTGWGLTRRESEQISQWETDVRNLHTEKELKLSVLKKELKTKEDSKIVTVQDNKATFFLLSSFIEILILIGVGFNAYYWYYSYNEFKLRVTRNPNYKKYKLFDYLLIVLYQNGAKTTGDDLPDTEGFQKLVRMHDCDATPTDVEDFITIALQLGIIKNPNGTTKVAIPFEAAQDKIKQYLIIQ